MSPRLLLAARTVAMLASADAAGAIIATNTIERDVTYSQAGARVRATGPIGCTQGERVSITVTVTQSATGAHARQRWTRRCSGEFNNRAARRSTLPEIRR